MATKLNKIKAGLPEFEAYPLPQRVPQITNRTNHGPRADFLRGAFGRAVLEEFRGRLRADFNNNEYLLVHKYNKKGDVVTGNNSFVVALDNQIVSQKGHRTAIQPDLEAILQIQDTRLELENHLEDTALVLRSDGDSYEPNHHLAIDLASQIKARTGKLEFPYMIPLIGLELVNDQDNPYGLGFKLREDAVIIPAPQLAHENNIRRFSRADENGLPIFEDDGSRMLYTRKDGLSRLYMDRYLDINSYWYGLANSLSAGRIVIVSGTAAPKKF